MNTAPGTRPVSPPLLLSLLLLIAACGEPQTDEDRAKKAAEQISRSQPDVEATALAQDTDSSAIEQAQKQLTALQEYQGEVNGVLDAVTVNAIEAFQRSVGLRDNGILDRRTREKLAEVAPNS